MFLNFFIQSMPYLFYKPSKELNTNIVIKLVIAKEKGDILGRVSRM